MLIFNELLARWYSMKIQHIMVLADSEYYKALSISPQFTGQKSQICAQSFARFDSMVVPVLSQSKSLHLASASIPIGS